MLERTPEEREQRRQQNFDRLRNVFRFHGPEKKKSVEEMLAEASQELGVTVELKKNG
jgi:hypothetical protein